MNFNIYKIVISVLVIPFLIASCDNHKADDGHDHGSHEEETESHDEHGHEDEMLTNVSLTQDQIQAVGIQLGTIENKELTATIRANGMLRVPNNNRANATTMYGGIVKSLNIQIGDYVKKGQLIATIANPQFIQIQEEYLTITSKITFAEQEVTRQQELQAGNAGVLKNLQNATAELNTFLSRKASLQQQILLMGINPNTVSNTNLKSALVVTSPLNGVISNVFAKIGSYVDVSLPVAEIVDNGSLHLDLQIFEKDLPILKVGQIIHFTLTNNPTAEYDAKVFSIGSSFENESKTIAVHCNVTGNKSGLIDGMNITGIVSLNNVTAPAVPNESIINVDGKDYIFIVVGMKKEDDHEHESGDGHKESEHTHDEANETNFEKREVIKGVSNMGYTAVTFIQDVPADAVIVAKGAFFINAKMSNTGGHSH